MSVLSLYYANAPPHTMTKKSYLQPQYYSYRNLLLLLLLNSHNHTPKIQKRDLRLYLEGSSASQRRVETSSK